MLRVAEHYSLTDVGRQRNANEDAYFEGDPLFAVADGMGGARAGEVASKTAVEALRPLGGSELGEKDLAEVVADANRRIHGLSRGDESLAGMGTTMTAAALRKNEIALAHVGDSRAYRLRGDELEKLTHDHSLVDEMVRAGRLTPEEAEVHPQRSIITRALGPEPEVEVERVTYPAKAGDVYLLSSDGLTTMMPEDAIGAILRARSSLKQAAGELVRAANEAGGRDNITVVLFRLAEAEGEPDDQATMVASDPEALRTEDVRAAVAAAERREPEQAKDATQVFSAEERGQMRRADTQRPPEPAPGRGRGKRVRRWAGALVGLLIVGAIGVGFWAGSRQFYFVGTDDRGLVTLYRGLPYELPLGLELYGEEYSSAVPVKSLPKTRRERVLDHRLRGKGDARDLIRQVERGELEE